jgi:hypothetical protein
LWPPFAPGKFPLGPLPAPRSKALVPLLSQRFLTTAKALTSRHASPRPFGLCLIAWLIPPALRPRGMNSIDGNTTRSPQVRRSSFPPCRPHTPCLRARCASISFALRLQARISALVADRFASGFKPRLRPGDSTQALRIPPRDGHPALLAAYARGRRVLPDLLSTHPPCEGAAGLSPAREAPCWAHNPIPTLMLQTDSLFSSITVLPVGMADCSRTVKFRGNSLKESFASEKLAIGGLLLSE